MQTKIEKIYYPKDEIKNDIFFKKEDDNFYARKKKNNEKSNILRKHNKSEKHEKIFCGNLKDIKIDCDNFKNEKDNYNNFFDSKIYLPELRASKEELKYFFKIICIMLEKNKKENIYVNLMNFLCKNFSIYIGLFANLWFQCKILLAEKLILIEFFKQLKINSEIINHFFNYGYDSFETILSITPQDLIKIQKFNNVTWIPGHAFRIKIIFSKINDYFKCFYEKNEDYIKEMKKFILHNRRKTKLTNQLILTQEKKNKRDKTDISPCTPTKKNVIKNYEPYISLKLKNENSIHNNQLYRNIPLLKYYQYCPYYKFHKNKF
ncbi:conserved Plasmodium protein, unknown function [Plasmodium gallinaceum]|uniref:Uncharacterized protein n=1 Tax=Plasmodium gallinaceum TaxID=5849 RepID=A0A1J1GXA1_PLAGA|nr:conserved Plasmodium protein, unknown function [Plasmodium gallinaceum]CRG97103.1 conserved Plasmodium protein, unknown function [Plasmodium gallinaceum]